MKTHQPENIYSFEERNRYQSPILNGNLLKMKGFMISFRTTQNKWVATYRHKFPLRIFKAYETITIHMPR